MAEMKHTAGPWKVFRTTDGEQIIGIGQASTGDGVTDPRFGLWCSGEEREANARLIAAAPELLEQLIAIQFGFNGRCPACAGWNVGPYGETDKAHTKDCPVALAISKATPNNLKDGRE